MWCDSVGEEIAEMFEACEGHYDQGNRLPSFDLPVLDRSPGARYLEAGAAERLRIVAELERRKPPSDPLFSVATPARKGHFLSPDAYDTIRRLAQAGVSQRRIAQRLGIARLTVYRILGGYAKLGRRRGKDQRPRARAA